MHKFFGKVLAGTVASLALLAWTSQADAFHHRWHGSGGWGGSGGSWGGSSGGWGGSSGGWGGSSGGWGGSSGGYGGHGGGWHHKRHRGYGSSGGWGSWGGGSSGGSWGGSSGGSSGGWGGSYYTPGGVIDPSTLPPGSTIPPAGTVPPAGTIPPAGTVPPPVPPAGTPTSSDGLLAVSVPEDAKIYVNGQPTSSTGSQRQYVSRDLKNGFNYSYEVRAEVVRDGKAIEQLKKVNVRAGETANLAFDFPSSTEPATSLTVHVPADAKVYLAGNATKASGETRVFRTTGLSGGKAWEGYTVRVELERGGRTLTKEETISLKAGESREIRFDFEGDKVASAR
jgi:uncharacterized protein (TIGR03000 family)